MSAEDKSEEELLRDLVLIDKAIREKEAVGHPGTYGMPDLLYPKNYKPGVPTYDIQGLHTSAPGEDFPDGWTREKAEEEETDSEYKYRQDTDLMSFLEANIYITKDGKRRYFRVIAQIKPFICDVFFLRSKKVIVWKPRGGGGSLGASVLIWLLMIYHKRSVLDISGSGEQSKVVYHYVCQFWGCIPGLSAGLLTDEPLKEETRLRNGVKLFCLLPGTEVYSGNGLTPIENIAVGDAVLSKDGRFNKVSHVFTHQKTEECVSLTVKGAPPVKTTADHKIWAVKLTDKQKKQQRAYGWQHFNAYDFQPQWIAAGDLTVDDLVCSPRVKTSPEDIALDWYEFSDKRADKKGNVSLNPDMYRLLGYWLAEGCRSQRRIIFSFNKTEIPYALDVKCIVEDNIGSHVAIKEDKTTLRVSFSNAGFERIIRDFGKKDTKRIPLEYLEKASDECLEQLLAGMFCGDGSITQSRCVKNGCEYYKSEGSYKTVSPHIAQIIMLISQRLGFLPNIHKYDFGHSTLKGVTYKRRPMYQIRFSGKDALAIAKLTHETFKTVTPNSFRQTGFFTEDLILRPVTKTERFAYSGPVHDISVDNDPSFSAPYVIFSNCRPGTEKQVRGKHMSTLAIDEVCQEDARVELAFRAALQTVLSEEEAIILLFSTFHLPSGLFQEYWDNAPEKGFTRVKWNVFDTMLPCKRGLEEATPEDPKALCYCEKCDLTTPEFTMDDRGRKVQIGWAWCHGQARTSQGWESYDKIVAAMRMNIGTDVFSTEFSCERPNYSNSIYGPEVVEKSLIDPTAVSEDGELHVGIDWGIQSKNSLAITLVERRLECITVHEAVFWDHKLVSDVVILLNEWTEKYRKPLKIYCDRSHPFNNADLRKAGFEVNPVDFGTYKNIGISNVAKYMIFRRMKINRELGVLIEQLKKYRSDDTGKALKIDDHGPDSLMCACLDWKFENLFGEDAHRVSLEDLRSQEDKQAMFHAKRVNVAAILGKDITTRIAVPKNFGINGIMP